MAAMIKYKFEDWWNGKVILEMAVLEYNVNEIKDKPTIVSWNDFKSKDQLKIKSKQKELFITAVNIQVERLKKGFKDLYKNSQIPDLVYSDELEQYFLIMFGKSPLTNEIIIEKNSILRFKLNHFQIIQEFIDKYIKKGITLNFDFVHSPNCVYQLKDTLCSIEAYAQSCWTYYKWLQDFIEKPKVVETFDIKDRIPFSRHHYLIFKNEASYNLFYKIMELTVNEDTRLADYSFIFHRLISSEVGAINRNTKHTTFIDFINKEHNAQIKANTLRVKNQPAKIKIFECIFEDYKNDIISQHQLQNNTLLTHK